MVAENGNARYLAAGAGGRRNSDDRQVLLRNGNAGVMVFHDGVAAERHNAGRFCTVERAAAAEGDHEVCAGRADLRGAGIDFLRLRVGRYVAVDSDNDAAAVRRELFRETVLDEERVADKKALFVPELPGDVRELPAHAFAEADAHRLNIFPIHSVSSLNAAVTRWQKCRRSAAGHT